MTAPDPRLIAHNCGKRLRKLVESTEWDSPEMLPLRKLFSEFADYRSTNTNTLRQLVELVGIRPPDQDALPHLSEQHAPLIWCGYYGATLAV